MKLLLKIIKEIFTSPYLWLGLILIAAFQVRTYRLERPLADWHAWRQADTAAVSRNFVKEGFTVLEPKYDDMSPVSEESLPNPGRFRYVEFPFYNLIVSALWLGTGISEPVARIVSIVFSLGAIVFLFLLTREFSNNLFALVASAIFAFLPFNIYYSTVIMPEPMLLFTMLGSLYFFKLWIDGNTLVKDLILGFLAILFFAVALLLKPTSAFLLLPIFYLAYTKYGLNFIKSAKVGIFLIISPLPFLAWRVISLAHPEGIPRWLWLLNTSGIRFKGAFFYWIVQDRLGRLILTLPGFGLFILGLVSKPFKKENLFFYMFLASMLAYVVVFAQGNVTHDYYQVPLLPILSIFVAKGVYFLVTFGKNLIQKGAGVLLALFLLILMFGLGWREVRDLFNINDQKIVEAGEVANLILPKDAKVIAPYGGNTVFLYYTQRPGWAIGLLPIPEMREKLGATHYVTVNFNSEAADLAAAYKTLYSNNRFVIIDLTQKKL